MDIKIRTIYQKVQNMDSAKKFWESFLEISPTQNSDKWCSFKLANVQFALLLNDYGDDLKGSNCVPVFELSDNEIGKYMEKAKRLGCVVVLDGLMDPNVQSIVFKDPFGSEFEISKVHS